MIDPARQDASLLQQPADGRAQICPRGFHECWASDENHVMPRLELSLQGVDRGPQTALSAIALHRAPDRLTGHDPKTARWQCIAADHDNKQRVGLRLPRAPHPLEVRLTGEPVSAIHLPWQGPGSI
jgi:hypothetical protein